MDKKEVRRNINFTAQSLALLDELKKATGSTQSSAVVWMALLDLGHKVLGSEQTKSILTPGEPCQE